jgi:hypothetical protein
VTETLGEIATLVRSKNAGPFWLTIDIFCGGEDEFKRVAASKVADRSVVAAIYHVDAGQVQIWVIASLRVVKISFPRPLVQGSLGDRDMHAGQQYVALLNLPVG